MKTRTKRLFSCAIVLMLISCAFAAWTALRVVAWARDLPNRIVIDADGFGEFFTTIIVESYHEALINGDPQTQSQVLRDFSGLVADNDIARKWVRTEYSSDLALLSLSPNVDVAALATELLETMAKTSNDDRGQSAEQDGGFGSRTPAYETLSPYSLSEPR